jgi:stage II sporulation protein R
MRVIQRYLYLFFTAAMLLAGWEYQWTNASAVNPEIPRDAIRLRILANSDAPGDQWIKRKIRDAIVASMNEWVADPDNLPEARAEVRKRLPELRRLVAQTLATYGYSGDFSLELKEADFPTKIYGNRVYPAGKYEALLITLGEGKGQNWWCVLFPPLCFVDAVSGDAVDQETAENAGETPDNGSATADGEQEERFEARFLLWEWWKKAGDFVRQLFPV